MRILEKGLREGKQREIEASIKRADKNLKSLNPLIYTPALKELQEATEGLSVCAKSSGAGGGDCGIALSFDPVETQTLIERWKEKNIEVIYQEGWEIRERKSKRPAYSLCLGAKLLL